MLTKDDNLIFLGNKIEEIKIAIFRPEIDSELRLPNNIITTLKTDSDGNIWFLTSCNGEYTHHIDRHFFASLEYYQKGQDCRLKLTGKSSIVQYDNECGSCEMETSTPGMNYVLIKFKMLYAEYTENRQTVPLSMKQKVKTFFRETFITNPHRLYDFS